MKRFLVVMATLLTLFSTPAKAQWVVIDPANLMQSIMEVYSSIAQEMAQAEMLANQYQQLEYDLRQLKSLAEGDVSGLLGTVQASLSTYRTYSGAVRGLMGDVSNAKSVAEDLYRRLAASGLSAADWMAREVEFNQKSQEGNGYLSDYQANVLQQVGRRYEEVRNLQSKITGTEGTHEAMQLMNSQMNVLLSTLNTTLEGNAVAAQRAALKEVEVAARQKTDLDQYKSWREKRKAEAQRSAGTIDSLAPSRVK